jgi:hypothetical protein
MMMAYFIAISIRVVGGVNVGRSGGSLPRGYLD